MEPNRSDLSEQLVTQSRRQLLQHSCVGLGSAALATMLRDEVSASEVGLERFDHRPKAKNVIFLHMVGAPSQLDLFDEKPILKKYDGKPCPPKLLDGKRFAFLRGELKMMGSPFSFARRGESGQNMSTLLPHLGELADDITLIRSLHTQQFNHAPAQLHFQTGFDRFGRPSFGSWVNYGLGSENENLPGFVVMITGQVAGAGNSLWGSGFLPTAYQGIEFRSKGDPVLFLANPSGVDDGDRRRAIEGINRLNRIQLADVGDPEIATRIAQYELAFRMQTSVPELMDLSQETGETIEMYGAAPGKESFANHCLLARRLVERGVRFIQLYDQGWDHHSGIEKNLQSKCKQVDKPIAALLKDLKRRGLLDETLVVFGSEFGRTPMLQGQIDAGKPKPNAGRDHHKDAFTVWMAGGGVKGGFSYGRTDELGFEIVENPVHVNDFHATLLHLLGLNHEKLTFKFQGRQFRLTDVAGKVIRDVIA